MAATNEELASLWNFVNNQRNILVESHSDVSDIGDNMAHIKRLSLGIAINTLTDIQDEINKLIK